MMKMATYSIVGDALKILPKLIEVFKKSLSEINDQEYRIENVTWEVAYVE